MDAIGATDIAAGTRRWVAAGQTPDRRQRHAGTKNALEGETQMPTIAVLVGGMSCRHCVREVTARLRDVVGVDIVIADAGSSVVRLSGTMGVDDVLGALRELSYPVQLLNESSET